MRLSSKLLRRSWWTVPSPPATRLEPIAEAECETGECSSPRLKLTAEDVSAEIEYWKLAVYGYVMGANPPRDVLDNFLRRMWSAYEITQISFLPNGLFVVRFAKPEHHKLVLANGMFIFDGKPIIVKPWDPSVRISKVSVKKVPIWVKLVGLDLKFWGAKCLEKLAGLVGRFIKIDDTTIEKSLLGFARLMIEVEIDQVFPNQIVFEDELGAEVRVSVEYDWLPITCQKCKGIGHNTSNSRKKELRNRRVVSQPLKQVWKPKLGGTVTTVDPKEFPPLRPTQTVESRNIEGIPGPLSTPVITPSHVNPGPIYTPARVISKMTRHESRRVAGKDKEFSATFNAELAEASDVVQATDVTELVDKGGGGGGGLLYPPMIKMGVWNVRGLNSDNKQKDIKWFLHHNDVDLFGLLETRVKPGSLNKVTNNVCYGWDFVTNTMLHSGGRIWILWKNNKVDVEVLEMADQFIHVKIKVLLTGHSFIATFVYAYNKIEDRVPLWNALLRNRVTGPWIVLGDFNNVMFSNERLGGIVKDDEMFPFQSTVNNCDLHDMKTTGAFFTWNNKQPSATRVFSRIDRVLINGDWLNLWPDWVAHFQPEGEFDHCPCVVFCGEMPKGKKRPFKFFNMWTKVEEYNVLVAQSKVADASHRYTYVQSGQEA
ncbi:uncharacterized protein LOC141597513 [Silene latifolia]|uniref:uncharacterized protein LOC141597513 n=1 Tax=Silene latifolia TaxID=37657 RepID=UPI003D7718B6